MPPRRLALCLTFTMLAVSSTSAAEIYLRWNQAGYTPERPKSLVAMSTTDLAGQAWRLERVGTAPGSTTAAITLQGNFGPSDIGAGDHTPFPFNHTADFSALTTPGIYRFATAGAAPAELRVAAAPYGPLLNEPLRHLRLMRSGSTDVAPRRLSHRGDAQAPVFVPVGDPADGKWQTAVPARAIDASGGWYDAGDQIKFTLNIAYTSYHLLLAYRLHPEAFGRPPAAAPLPALLAEAHHGLEFLMRTFPDPDTFLIQVGDERDHEQSHRLPENDPLDGRRPALCALSRTHMAAAAAALALGARTFRELGRPADAERYTRQARTIHARTLEPGTVAVAFERGKINDFYLDPTETDQRALAAAELHALTGEPSYLAEAIAYTPPPGAEVSWASWNWLANTAIAPLDPTARQRLLAETASYAYRAANEGRPWSIPSPYTWGSLHRWIGAANAARLAALQFGAPADHDALFLGLLDYTFGRNNWGASFVFSERLPNTVRQIYNPTYHLLGIFPTGALSEGPGDRATHRLLEKHFNAAPGDPLARFDSPAAVFRDNSGDFMCQESTIGGQADLILLLTLASLPATASP